MIQWKDFVFDEVLGPVLSCRDDEAQTSSSSIMEDAVIDQETYQDETPILQSQEGSLVQDGLGEEATSQNSDLTLTNGMEAARGWDHHRHREGE